MRTYSYSAVVPSRDLDSIRFSVGYLTENSQNLNDVIVFWNGSKSEESKMASLVHELNAKSHIHVGWLAGYGHDVYEMYNEGVVRAPMDYCLLLNDDMYFPPDWDKELPILMLQPFNPASTVVTFSLVEPGYVDVNSKCIRADFGQTIETFDKAGFDKYAEQSQHIIGSGLGWYMPVIFPKNLFILAGCYPIIQPFPFPNDIHFFETLKKHNTHFAKVDSLVYHFQRLSQRPGREPFEKLNLCCGDDIRDGYVNADVMWSPRIFKVDVEKGPLPWAENRFQEVLMNHALEHFLPERARELLVEIHRILKPGGHLEIAVPDLAMACEDFLAGFNGLDNCAPAILRIYGQGTSEFRIHKWGYTSETLEEALLMTGFSDVSKINSIYNDEVRFKAIK